MLKYCLGNKAFIKEYCCKKIRNYSLESSFFCIKKYFFSYLLFVDFLNDINYH